MLKQTTTAWAVFLALLFIAALPVAEAHAQYHVQSGRHTADYAVSNFITLGAVSDGERHVVQPFTTPAGTTPIPLTAIEFPMRNARNINLGGDDLIMALYNGQVNDSENEDDQTFAPNIPTGITYTGSTASGYLFRFSNPSSISSSEHNVFTAPAGTTLQPGTTYHLFIGVQGGGSINVHSLNGGNNMRVRECNSVTGFFDVKRNDRADWTIGYAQTNLDAGAFDGTSSTHETKSLFLNVVGNPNSGPTGLMITGGFGVGQTLTADFSNYMDADGLAGPATATNQEKIQLILNDIFDRDIFLPFRWFERDLRSDGTPTGDPRDKTGVGGVTNEDEAEFPTFESLTYTLRESDLDKQIGVHAVNIGDANCFGNTVTVAVVNTNVEDTTPPTGFPAVSGTLDEGERLTVDTSALADGNGLPEVSEFTYQWRRADADGSSEEDIGGATEAAYILTGDDIDKRIGVTVLFTDRGGHAETRRGELTAGTATGKPRVTVRAVDSEVGEGGSAVFEFTRSGDTSQALEIQFAVFQAPTGDVLAATPDTTLTFSGNSATARATLSVGSNTTPDMDDIFGTLGVQVTTPGGVPAYFPDDPAQATVTVLDDDGAQVVRVSAVADEITEGDTAEWVFTRSGSTAQELEVQVMFLANVVDASSLNLPATITIPANQVSVRLSRMIPGNNLAQGAGWIQVRIGLGETYERAADNARRGSRITVLDDDAATVTIAAVDDTLAEGTDTEMVWTITRTGDTTEALTVRLVYTEPNGSVSHARSVTISAGQSSGRHSEMIMDDNVGDADVARMVILEDPGYQRGDPFEATITVAEDDVTLTVEVVDLIATEDTSSVRVRVIRTGNLRRLPYQIESQRLEEGIDMPNPPRTRDNVMQAGEIIDEYQAIFGGRDLNDRDTRHVFTLLPGSGYTLGDPHTVTAFRYDNDGAAISVEPCSGDGDITEGETGSVRFTRHGSTSQPLTFGFEVLQVITGADNVLELFPEGIISIVPHREQLTFNAGRSSFCYEVPTRDDDVDEEDSVVRVTLDEAEEDAGWYRGGTGQTEFTVLDDDLPVVTIMGTFPDFEEEDPGIQFRVIRMGDTTDALDVRTLYTNRDGVESEIIATIPAGAAFMNFTAETLNVMNDTPSDPYEVSIALAESALGEGYYLIGSPSEDTVIIFDQDGAPVINSARVGDADRSEGDTLVWELTRTASAEDLMEVFTIEYGFRFSNVHPLLGDTYERGGTATFAANETTTRVMLETTDDNIAEPDGTVYLDLDRTSNFDWVVVGSARLEEQRTQFNIMDDDPGPPTGLAARTAPESIILNWDAPSDTGGSAIAGYRIERSADGNDPWTDQAANTGNADTTYTHGSLSGGETFHYRVSAINADGNTGVVSETASATAGGMGAGAPRNLSAAAGILSIRVDWDAPVGASGAGITGYRIEQSADAGANWSVLVANTENTATVYSHVGLAAGRTVHYRVRAINAAGVDAPSGTASATARALPSGTPTAEVRAQDTAVVGDGLNDVVFLFRTSNSMQIDTHFSITGRSAITGNTAISRLSGGSVSGIRHGEQRRIQTVALAPGSDPVEVTFTFIVSRNGLTESGHAITTGRGSATVTVTAPPAPVETLLLAGSTAWRTNRNDLDVSANQWHAQSFRTGSHSDGYDIDSVVLLLSTTNGSDRTSTSAVVTLREANGDNPSDTILATMQNPSMIRHDRLNFFTAPPGTRLGARTRYHVVVHQPAGAAGGIRLKTTNRGSTGFNARRAYDGTSWRDDSGGGNPSVLMLQVRGSEAAPAPGAPTGLMAVARPLVIGLSWTAPTGGAGDATVTGYRIEQSTDAGSTWSVAEADTGNTNTSWVLGGLTANQAVHYRVSAINAGGVGAVSGTANAVAAAVAPALIGNLSRSHSGGVIPTRTRSYAQGVITGGHEDGYTLSSVTLDVHRALADFDGSTPVLITVRNEVDGNPGAMVLATLTGPTNFGALADSNPSHAVFTTQDAITLSPRTRYYFVITQDVAANGVDFARVHPLQSAPDAGALSGWLIDDRHKWNQGSGWTLAGPIGTDRAIALRLHGAPATPAPRMTAGGDTIFISNTMQAATSGVAANNLNSRAQSFHTGNAAHGYEITNVVLTLFASYTHAANSMLQVQIRNDNGGHPGNTVIANFDRPGTSISRGDATFPLRSGETARLEPGTTYHLYVASNNSTGISLFVSDTTDLDDFPARGWRVPHLPSTLSGSTWSREVGGGYLKFQIQGNEAPAPMAPGAPTGLAAMARPLSIRLGWTAPANTGGRDITGYRIEQSTDAGANWSNLEANTGNTNTTYIHGGLAANRTVHYRVSAINVAGPGAASGTASAAAAAASPLLVSNLGQSHSGFGTPTRTRSYAQGLMTGNHDGGYTLTSVTLEIDQILESFNRAVPAVITVRREVSGDPDSTALGTLTGPTNLAAIADLNPSHAVFTTPEEIRLAANTRYYIVVEQDVAANGFEFALVHPHENNLDSGGGGGFQIDDEHKWNQGGSWVLADATGDDRAIALRLGGEEISASATAPGAPTGLSATAGALSIRLSWTAPASDGGAAIIGYFIERASGDCSGNPTFTELVADTGNTDLTHTDENLNAGAAFCYRVSAINSEDTGAASNTASATAGAAPASATAPGAPTGLSATAGTLSIVLGWTAPANTGGAAIIGYFIERASGDCSGNPAFTELVADTGNTDLTHTDENLTAGASWCYRVSAINAVDTGAASNTASATAEAVPVAMTTPDFGASTTIAEQQWTIGTAVTLQLPTATSGDGALRYALTPTLPNGVRLSGAPACAGASGCSISGTPMGISAVRQDETYTWRVVDSDSDTADSDADELTFDITVAATAPGAPSGLSATATGALSIVLEWTAPANDGGSAITGYQIERADAPGDCSGSTTFTPLVANTGDTLTHTDTGLTEGDAWCYRVSATNAVGTGAASDPPDSATATLDSAPDFGSETIAGQQWRIRTAVMLDLPTATGGEGDLGYALTPALPNGVTLTGLPDCASGCSLGGTPATAAAVRDGVTYTWRVVDSDGNTADSDADEISFDITVAAVAPARPTSLEAVENPEMLSIRLGWTAPTDNGGSAITGYFIERASGACSSSSSFTPLVTNTGNTERTHTDEGLNKGDAWCYRVSAINAVGRGDASDPPAGAMVPRTAPGAPTGLAATANVETLSIMLRWVAPEDNGGSPITGYVIEHASGGCGGTPMFEELETVTGLTHSHTGLSLGDTWCYRVSAVNRVGTGDPSDPESASFVDEDEVHKATEAALALLAPNVASGAIQVLTSRFDSLSAPGAAGAGAARNTAMLGGRPLGSFAGSGVSAADTAREVASFFGVSLPHVHSGYGGGGGAGGAARGGSVSGGGRYGAAFAGDCVVLNRGRSLRSVVSATQSQGSPQGDCAAGAGNTGGASAELAFAPATPGELEAQAGERNTEGRGADEADHWRRQDLGAWLGVSDLQSPDLKSLLSQSSFSVTFGPAHGAADDPGAGGGLFGGRWTVWGQGAAGGFEGKEKDSALSVEGDSISAYLGADVQRGDLALGLAVGQSSGDMDYAGSAEGSSSGSLETELTSLHPYLNWSPNPGLSMYLMLGYGIGEADLKEDKLDQTLNTDLDMLMLALGGRRTLGGDASGRRYEVKVDAFMVEIGSDGARASGDVNFEWRSADAQASRLRAALAGVAPLPVGAQNTLLAEGELAARLDGGDAQTGVGAELGAGLRWRQGGFSLAARGRLLLVHSENDYEDYKEWGASLTASYDAGEMGRGFRATLAPVWGDAESDAGALYEGAGALRDVGGGGGAQQMRSGLLPDRLAFEFGYGVGLLGGRALLLPFGSFSFAGGGDASSDTQLRLGTRVDLSQALGGVGEFAVQRLGFELFGETQAGADRERRVGLELRLGF